MDNHDGRILVDKTITRFCLGDNIAHTDFPHRSQTRDGYPLIARFQTQLKAGGQTRIDIRLQRYTAKRARAEHPKENDNKKRQREIPQGPWWLLRDFFSPLSSCLASGCAHKMLLSLRPIAGQRPLAHPCWRCRKVTAWARETIWSGLKLFPPVPLVIPLATAQVTALA